MDRNCYPRLTCDQSRGFIKFLCRRSVGFFSWAFLVFLMKESKKRRRKQPGKLMAKSHSQPVNLPGAQPLMNSLSILEQHLFQYLIDTPVNTQSTLNQHLIDILIDTQTTLDQQLVDSRPCQITHMHLSKIG